jgi:hypothetical protein
MRRTINLDDDVEQILCTALERSGGSFEVLLNAAVRAGLSGKPLASTGASFVVRARPLGLRAGIDPAGLNKLVDDLEVDAVLEKMARMET